MEGRFRMDTSSKREQRLQIAELSIMLMQRVDTCMPWE